MNDESFSARQGLDPLDVPIQVREAAPGQIRQAVLHFAVDCGLTAHVARAIALRHLDAPPEEQMWFGDNGKLSEVQRRLAEAKWYEIYDIAELFWSHLNSTSASSAAEYATRLNRAFVRHGVGWQLLGGRVEARGSEAFQSGVARARAELAAAGLEVASRELHEALRDLSRRPEPDLTGSVQHAVAAFECVARHVTGRKETLGALLKAEKSLFPPPLGDALEKVWGFASERARHVREGGSISHPEAELLVGLSASAITYVCTQLQPAV